MADARRCWRPSRSFYSPWPRTPHLMHGTPLPPPPPPTHTHLRVFGLRRALCEQAAPAALIAHAALGQAVATLQRITFTASCICIHTSFHFSTSLQESRLLLIRGCCLHVVRLEAPAQCSPNPRSTVSLNP